MDFITPFIEPIISCLVNPLMKQIKYFVKAKTNVENLAISLEDLRACRDDLQKEIADAERARKQSTNEVELWLRKVGDIEVQVDRTKINYEHRGCGLFGDYSLNCWSTYKFGKEAATLLNEMVQLKTKRDDFRSVATTQPPGHDNVMPIESTLLGLDQYAEMVRNYLIDDNVGVIGIHGMGGVGKTTLLKEINNSLSGENNMGFKYLIWVVVSKEFQLLKVQDQVAKKLKLELEDKDDANQNSKIIFNYLKDKSFLLMLDDVWEGFNILDVGIPDTHCSSHSNNQTVRRQKVILTTRFKKVCGSMRAERILRVECLNRVDARKLFKKTLGEWYLTSNAGVHRLIEQVADECAGLPLALVVIARAMSTKTTIQEWQAAVVSLKRSQENKLLGEENYMFSTLKFSYDSLQNDDLRMCFLYCSLWPEDHNIRKQEIIAICIGSGIIKDFENVSEAYDMGHCLIEELKGACLLEVGSNVQDQVKMHDVIRDLALWIASECGENKNKWLVKSGIGLQEVQLEVEKWKEAHVVSLMHNRIEEFPCVPFECPNLSILMLQGNYQLGKIHPSIFQNMPALTVLNLQNTSMKELPESIGMLTMLQHLNLRNTRLRSLPKGLGNLTRLRYLDVSELDSLVSIPAGVISSLVELQVLDLSWTGIDIDLDCCPEVEKNDGEQFNVTSDKKPSLIDEVECLPGGLKGFGIALDSADDFCHLSKLSRVFTWHLRLMGMQNLDIVQLKRNMWSSLQWLMLNHIVDVKVLEFAEGMINDTCPIEALGIQEAWELEEIIFRGVVPSVFFQRLVVVVIAGCHRLKNISWILGLQSLKYLELKDCKGMELLISEVPGGEEEGGRTITFDFPRLEVLKLEGLQDLRSICCGSITRIGFPALEELAVTGCHRLKNINWIIGFQSLKYLELKDCKGMELLISEVPGGEEEGGRTITFDFPRLEVLILEGLQDLRSICCGPITRIGFPALEYLAVTGCYRLKNINWILGLQSLVRLLLKDCKGMELLISEGPGGEEEGGRTITFDFPRLEDLTLLGLQDLRSICCGPITRIGFPALEELTVKGCPNLKKFPFLPPNINNLQITCDDEWWQGLEVEESIKNSLKETITIFE